MYIRRWSVRRTNRFQVAVVQNQAHFFDNPLLPDLSVLLRMTQHVSLNACSIFADPLLPSSCPSQRTVLPVIVRTNSSLHNRSEHDWSCDGFESAPPDHPLLEHAILARSLPNFAIMLFDAIGALFHRGFGYGYGRNATFSRSRN